MKDSPPKKVDHFSKVADKICLIFGVIAGFILSVAWHALKGIKFKNPITWRVILGVICACYLSIHFNYFHLRVLHWVLPGIFSKKFLYFIVTEISDFAHFLIMVFSIFVWVLFFMGIFDFLRRQKFQKGISRLGLKNATGETPQVIGHYSPDEFVTTLRIKSPGMGIEQYKSRKADLEAAFGQIIQKIEVSSKDRQVIEITLTSKELLEILYFRDCVSELKVPYSFVVGSFLGGILVQCLLDLPHLLIAGASGGGKTYFFNQIVIGLMRTSRHIQFYLLDLKRGIGTAELKVLPNVLVAKDEDNALIYLKLIYNEMHERFKYLESKGYKVIDPKRDKMDIIVVGVDEASVLYTKDTSDKERNEKIKEARSHTESISKLGRAAGIHLILATQKVSKETIDTRIQENMGGKLCFKAETLQGSNAVLGNKMALELPDIKGRAIWAKGSKFVEVQTPFIPDGELVEEVEKLRQKVEADTEFLFQPMLDFTSTLRKQKTDVVDVSEAF